MECGGLAVSQDGVAYVLKEKTNAFRIHIICKLRTFIISNHNFYYRLESSLTHFKYTQATET